MIQKNQNRSVRPSWLFLVFLFAVISTANAHPATNPYGGFYAGMMHPMTRLDHIVAMVAVGLRGASLGPPALWLLPFVFPLVMAWGDTGLLHLTGISIGLLTWWPWGKVVVGSLGSVIMVIGFGFFFGFL